MSFTDEKKALRKEIKTQLAIYNPEQLAESSEKALNKIEQEAAFLNAKTVLLFWSLPDEVNTHDFIVKWSKKKTILLPVIVNDNLEAHYFEGKDKLETGLYNISQPASKLYKGTIDLAIVPGQAFDTKGHRLGRGKGFYDKFLSSFNGFKIGICFDFQLQEYIPHEEFDISMNLVVAGELAHLF